MSRFNFSNVLGGAVFGGLNAFLQHNASRDGYAKQNRYEVVILLPSGVSGGSAQDAGTSAMSGYITGNLHGETARRISFRCNNITIPARSLRTSINSNIYEALNIKSYKVKLMHQLQQSFIVVLTLQKDTFLKSGKRLHTIQIHII